MIWQQLIVLAVSYVISVVTRPKPQNAKPQAWDTTKLPKSAEGTPQAIDFGTCWSEEWMVLGSANFTTQAIQKKNGKK